MWIQAVKSLPKLLLLGLSALLVGLLSYIALYNCPSVLDEYCFAATARTFGFWTAQKMYYVGWTGRYFSNFLFHANPLYFSDSRMPFIVIPIILTLGFIINSFYLAKAFLKGTDLERHAFWFALAVLCLYYLELPSIVENNYWMIGTYTFISGNMVMLFLNGWLHHQRVGSNRLFAGIAVLYFLILGSSEVSMLCLTAVLGLRALYRTVQTKRLWTQDLLLGGIALVGNLLVIKAPGNSVRNPENRALSESLTNNVKFLGEVLADWVLHSPLLWVATAAYVLVLSQSDIRERFRFKAPLWATLGTFAIVLFLAFVPTTFGTNWQAPPRILNLIYLLFLIGWFYHVTLIASLIGWSIKPAYVQVGSMALVVATLVFAVRTENVKEMYRDIKYGKLEGFLAEYQDRWQHFRSGSKTITIKPYTIKPFSLYTGDVEKDPKHLWNKCIGQYYGNKTIFLETFNQ